MDCDRGPTPREGFGMKTRNLTMRKKQTTLRWSEREQKEVILLRMDEKEGWNNRPDPGSSAWNGRQC